MTYNNQEKFICKAFEDVKRLPPKHHDLLFWEIRFFFWEIETDSKQTAEYPKSVLQNVSSHEEEKTVLLEAASAVCHWSPVREVLFLDNGLQLLGFVDTEWVLTLITGWSVSKETAGSTERFCQQSNLKKWMSVISRHNPMKISTVQYIDCLKRTKSIKEQVTISENLPSYTYICTYLQRPVLSLGLTGFISCCDRAVCASSAAAIQQFNNNE